MRISKIPKYGPVFQAQFSKDDETKSILKEHARKNSSSSPIVYSAICLLDEVDTNDSISIKKQTEAKTHYIIKNDTTGKEVKITPNYYNSLFDQLNHLIFDHTAPDHKTLLGSNTPLPSAKIYEHFSSYNIMKNKELDKKSGSEEVDKTSDELNNKIKKLEKEIIQNKNKIGELFYKKWELHSDYVSSIIDAKDTVSE